MKGGRDNNGTITERVLIFNFLKAFKKSYSML